MVDSAYDPSGVALSYNSIELAWIVGTITKILWKADIHPESEGLKQIPHYFALDVDKYVPTRVVISEGCRSIEFEAFNGCHLTQVDIPPSVEYIGNYGFSSSYLESFKLPERSKVDYLLDSTFFACNDLKSVWLPEGFHTLYGDVFSECSVLESVHLPSTLNRIGSRCFSFCRNLTRLDYEGTMEQWSKMTRDNRWHEKSSILQIVCKDGTIGRDSELFT